MKDLMNWEECTSQYLREVSVDIEKIDSIVELARERLDFAHSISLTEKNVSFIFDNYYEIIKELLVALLLKNGLRSSNHQCLFSFFAQKFPLKEFEMRVMQQMNFLRNRLNYYGERISYTYFTENYKSFEEIIKLLLRLVRE